MQVLMGGLMLFATEMPVLSLSDCLVRQARNFLARILNAKWSST